MKLYTARLENMDGVIINAAVIQARGWDHAIEQIPEAWGLSNESSKQSIYRHSKEAKREYCDSCDGTGLMEGWNRRDGSSCPKCHGAAVIVIEPASAEKG